MSQNEKMKMQPSAVVKRKLAAFFDENPHNSIWKRVVEFVILALIVISSVGVFLSTFENIASQIAGLLRFIDVLTTLVFTVEVSLRIWTADLLDERYKGFWGRVRYCLSFYGLIDFLSTYLFYFTFIFDIPLGFLKILRVARLFRLFRYMRSFRILRLALESKRQELVISFAFLSILTVILSFFLYFAEHEAQPENCENGWAALVWAFAKYLGDPGKIADFPLVTFWGHLIAAIVGILGIAIFAVPAGLIGSGFVEVIEERNHRQEVERNIERVQRGLRWEKDQHCSNLYHVPLYKALDTFLVKQYLTKTEIVEAVKGANNLHLYNLARAYNPEDEPLDRLVVVGGFCNTAYGCCIDRGSNVTIVSTSTADDPLMGWTAFHLAKLGGFNYVSKGVEVNLDEPVSYYNIDDPDCQQQLVDFLADIRDLSSKPDSWVIPISSSTGPKSREHKIHLCYSPVKHDYGYDNPYSTVADTNTFDAFCSDMSSSMLDFFGLKTDRNDYYIISSRNILRHIGCKNSFVLRLECHAFYFPLDRMGKIMKMAEVIKRHMEPGVNMLIPPEMQKRPEKCFGFEGYVD